MNDSDQDKTQDVHPADEEQLKDLNKSFDSSSEDETADTQTNEVSTPHPPSMVVPVIALNSVVVFPFALTPLVINGDSAIRIAESAQSDEQRLVGLFPEIPPDKTQLAKTLADVNVDLGEQLIEEKAVSPVGVLARIVKVMKFPDGTVRVLVRGISRIRYMEQQQSGSHPGARIEKVITQEDHSLETSAMLRNATRQFQEIVSFSPNFPDELKVTVMNLNDNARVVDLIADTMNIAYYEKLAILAIPTIQERLQLLTILLNREVEVLRLGSEIQNQVHNAMSKSQREFFLREQLRAIKEELGEGNRNPDVVSIMERLEKISMPGSVEALVRKETERLEMIPQASGEYNIAYTYIDWLLSVPWNEFTEDRLDVKKAATILDRDHFGLKDVKERILEYLSVLQINQSRKAPILCFVGPPGVGKTSLGKSIADAMNRKFIRISLGGIKDEAEIRGHRRTYIGALPGRIIQGMKKAGSSNPVFMLDELDKVGGDYRGDPASALLEVLDPQQNFAFNDHYLEVDYDLSSVMFIATANISDTIPSPLLDRMEVIRLAGYTAVEKKEIAKRYLVPRQMKENGLEGRKISFLSSAIDEIINYYTMEAGVRNLERTIGTICRKVARQVVEGIVMPEMWPMKIDSSLVQELLGPRKFLMDVTGTVPEVAVATGMAWTSVGGSILQVEATKMMGKGDLKLTGSLGNVMKESAMTAFSFIRSNADVLGIDPQIFQNSEFHIHVPDGATPKDGPSAGVTLTTALVSLLTGRPVRPRLSMTGEITLRGKVTAVGGIKEKVIAALRSGVRTVIMPEENEKDLLDVPQEVKEQIQFHFVKNIKQVLDLALIAPPKHKTAKSHSASKSPKENTEETAEPKTDKKTVAKSSAGQSKRKTQQ